MVRSGPDSGDIAIQIVGGALLLCGIGSTATAIGRWTHVYRELARRGAAPAPADDSAPVPLQTPPLASPHAYKASSAITGA